MESLGNGIYRAESDSNASITYLVDIGATNPTCTCTAFAIKRNKVLSTTGKQGGGHCKHIDRAIKMGGVTVNATLEKEVNDLERDMARIRLQALLKGLEEGEDEDE